MTTTTINGQQRKSLAEQIDRLDGILDGLANGLNEAVVTAVKDAVTLAVKQAVQAVMTEVLTNQDLLTLLRGPLSQAATAAAEPMSAAVASEFRPVGRLARIRSWAYRQWGQAKAGCAAVLRLGSCTLGASWRLLRQFKGQVLLALGVGAAAGVGAYLCGPWLAAGAAWLGGFAAALAVQAGMTLRRALAAVSFAGQ